MGVCFVLAFVKGLVLWRGRNRGVSVGFTVGSLCLPSEKSDLLGRNSVGLLTGLYLARVSKP